MINNQFYGHQKILDYFSRIIEKGKLSSSYLFSGVEGIGKFTLACFLAKKISAPSDILCLCQEDEFKEKIKIPKINFSHSLKIEDIRRVIDFVGFSSFEKRKVIILDDFHLSTIEAQNAFLKTLEEGRGNSLFFLISSQKEKILPTIISRLQVINFLPLERKEVEKFLEEQLSLKKERAEEISLFSFGSILRAIKIANNFEQWQKKRKEFLKAFSPSIRERLLLLEKIDKEENWSEFLDELLFFLYSYFRRQLDRKSAFLLKKILKLQFALNSYNLNKRWQIEYFVLSLPSIQENA